jgi:hypothetical protein
MDHFYDGQIRRYVNQIIRAISGFKWKSADGKISTIPVTYGDITRQVASIIRDNSENKIPSAPRMAVYITGISLDRSRIGDSTFVSKVHIRERRKEYDSSGDFAGYTQQQGDKYTVERLMPTPYKLTVKADLWSTNTDQKLQIMEQIMMMFNPSLELQTTDNFIDWTSISVLELTDISFSSRQIPMGIDSEIDIATLTFESPIWINPPSKVKRLGVIQDIIMNINDEGMTFATDERVTIGGGTFGTGFDVFVYYNKPTEQYYVELIDAKTAVESILGSNLDVNLNLTAINWHTLFEAARGTYKAGSSQLFLRQPSGNEVIGTFAVSEIDPTKLIIQFDQDTYPTNTVIIGPGITKGTIDAIVDPQKQGPRGSGLTNSIPGTRYLLINDIGSADNTDGADAWKNDDGTDFLAQINDIIEWYINPQTNQGQWQVVMGAIGVDEIVYTTNIRTGVQYKFENGEWTRSFEGEYSRGQWKLVL